MWNPALKSAASFSRSKVAALQHNFLEIGWTTVLLRVQGMEVNKELKVHKAHATLLHLEGSKKYGTPESQAPKLQNKAAEQPRRLAILRASGNLRKAHSCLQLIACLCYPTLRCHRSRLSQLSSFLGGSAILQSIFQQKLALVKHVLNQVHTQSKRGWMQNTCEANPAAPRINNSKQLVSLSTLADPAHVTFNTRRLPNLILQG